MTVYALGLAKDITVASIRDKLNAGIPVLGNDGVNPVSSSNPLTITGSVTSSALTDAQLRASAVPVTFSGTVTTNSLTDTQLRASPVPISGTVVTGGLTDTQLRATPVPISGAVTANTGLTQPLTDTQLRASPVPVTDDCTTFTADHRTLTASTDTTITFASAVRLIRIANWDTSSSILVKNGVITSDTDAAASRVGYAPVANVPNTRVFPYKTTTIHIRSPAASTVTVEGYA